MSNQARRASTAERTGTVPVLPTCLAVTSRTVVRVAHSGKQFSAIKRSVFDCQETVFRTGENGNVPIATRAFDGSLRKHDRPKHGGTAAGQGTGGGELLDGDQSSNCRATTWTWDRPTGRSPAMAFGWRRRAGGLAVTAQHEWPKHPPARVRDERLLRSDTRDGPK
jgi:hypothetical protein